MKLFITLFAILALTTAHAGYILPNGSLVGSNAILDVSDLIDEDAMGSDSAVLVPSQQSVKAYVDALAPALTLIDEDNLVSDDATKPPSQQSVKAYVDTAIGTTILTSALLDEDAMGSDSATAPASQQSIKAYVDAADALLFLQSNFIDEDSFATDSATKVPSQQSVKAYVAATVSASSEMVADYTLTNDAAAASIGIDLDEASVRGANVDCKAWRKDDGA